LAKNQESPKMIITNIFADNFCNLHNAPICFVLMVSWGNYNMIFDGMSSYFLISIFTGILDGN
jgi:hypothetical protein